MFWSWSMSFFHLVFVFHFHSFVAVDCLNIFQFVYPFFCWQILGLKLLRAFLSQSLYEHAHFFFLSMYLWMELLNHRVRFRFSKSDLECSSEWRTINQMIKIKLNSTYDWSKEYWVYTVCKIWPRGDFLILLKYLKANFKEERNTLPIFTK